MPLDAIPFNDEALEHASDTPSSGLGAWFTMGKHVAGRWGVSVEQKNGRNNINCVERAQSDS